MPTRGKQQRCKKRGKLPKQNVKVSLSSRALNYTHGHSFLLCILLNQLSRIWYGGWRSFCFTCKLLFFYASCMYNLFFSFVCIVFFRLYVLFFTVVLFPFFATNNTPSLPCHTHTHTPLLPPSFFKWSTRETVLQHAKKAVTDNPGLTDLVLEHFLFWILK